MYSARCQLLRQGFLTKNGKSFALTLEAGISSSAVQRSSYYEALGIQKTSTQEDIKQAYYKLSMLYHPDKNQGCQTSAQRFREISQAYEVLGNYKLRRLYDKGIIHTAGRQYSSPAASVMEDFHPEVEDDPQTKFYKSRFTKSQVSEGRTPIYNFDEWSRAHYGASFQRRQNAQKKWNKTQKHNREAALSIQNEVVIFGLALCLVMLYGIFYVESSYDTPKKRDDRKDTTDR